MRIRKKIIYLALALIPALVTFFNWHRLDKSGVYACSAEGLSYISTAQDIVGKLHGTQSLVESVSVIYQTRIWKGFILPQIYLPFYIAGGYDINRGLFLLQLFFLCTFLIYLFLLASEFLPPWPSVVVTVAASTVPWISDFSFMFDSYFPFVTVALGATYHLVRSNYFLNKNHSLLFGLAAGLAACIRPGELVLNFAFPMVVFLFLTYRGTKQFNVRDLLMVLCLLAATSVAMIALKDTPYGQGKSWILFILIPIQIAPLFLQRKLKLSPNVTLAFCSSIILFSIWWIPFITVFVSWQSTASIGDIAHAFPRPPSMNYFDFLGYHFRLLLGVGFLLPFSILLLRSIMMLKKYHNLKAYDRNEICFLIIFLYLFFVPITVTGWFPTLVLNNSVGIFCTIWVITLLLSLKELRGPKLNVVTLAILLLAANQFLYLSEKTVDSHRNAYLAKLLPRGGRVAQNVAAQTIYFQKLSEILSAHPRREDKAPTVSVVNRRKLWKIANIDKIFAFMSQQENQPIKFVTNPKLARDKECEEDPTCVRDLFQKSDYVLMVDLEWWKETASPKKSVWADKIFKSGGECDLRRIGNIEPVGPPEEFGLNFQVYEKICSPINRNSSSS